MFLGNGDGTFQEQESFPVDTTPFQVALADFNGDGRLDIAAANSHSANVGILLNQHE